MHWGAPEMQPPDPEAKQGSPSFLSLYKNCVGGGCSSANGGRIQCDCVWCVYRCDLAMCVCVNGCVAGVHECPLCVMRG